MIAGKTFTRNHLGKFAKKGKNKPKIKGKTNKRTKDSLPNTKKTEKKRSK